MPGRQAHHAIVFITAEATTWGNGEVYDYKDRISNDVHDPDNWDVIWKGQKKHGQDYIITEGTREVHVCARRRTSLPYKYFGTIKNETIHCMYQGNAANNDPSAYFFELETHDLRVPFQSTLSGDLTPQAQAVRSLGFTFTRRNCGIHKMWPLE